jgi:glycosyltransferase involved in cell wall biosynthesis
MASGLPVVVPAIDRIATLVGHNREGLLYDTAIRTGLPHAFEALTDPALRGRLGRAARERALREYSWAAHCRALDAAMTRALKARNRNAGPDIR